MNKTSSQLKQEAKSALKGRWKDAVFLNIVPSILNILAVWVTVVITIAAIGVAVYFVTNSDILNSESTYEQRSDVFDDDFEDMDDLDEDDFDLESTINEAASSNGNFGLSFGNTLIQWVFTLVLSFMTIGISFTFIEVLRNPKRKINPANDQFRMFNGKDFVPLFLVQILTSLFVYLWSLLFVIPGIIKGYAYSQAFYIYKDLSEHTDTQTLSANNYITESKLLMNGNKGRLFYIDLSFLGWHFLSLITLGIGYLFLNPYINATKAAFYLDISKDRYAPATVEEAEVIESEDEWTSF